MRTSPSLPENTVLGFKSGEDEGRAGIRTEAGLEGSF